MNKGQKQDAERCALLGRLFIGTKLFLAGTVTLRKVRHMYMVRKGKGKWTKHQQNVQLENKQMFFHWRIEKENNILCWIVVWCSCLVLLLLALMLVLLVVSTILSDPTNS